MIIFVMRHGEAEPYKRDDQSRHLTRFGLTQSEHASKWMSKQLNEDTELKQIDLTLVSPYVRTIETLEAVEQFMPIRNKVQTSAVTPDGNAKQAHDLIDGELLQDNDINSLLIISHMPLVSLLSDAICHGFNARVFGTADVLMINYDLERSSGRQLAFYQSLT
ncbi:MAG: phosphohistidine phosphatase [Glaciecola sp.]|jgi:phosphohistidine phosphatase